MLLVGVAILDVSRKPFQGFQAISTYFFLYIVKMVVGCRKPFQGFQAISTTGGLRLNIIMMTSRKPFQGFQAISKYCLGSRF